MRRDETMKRTMSKLREENKIIPANVSEDEVKEAFERSRAALPKKPASVTFRQIVIPPKPSAAAKNLARAKYVSRLDIDVGRLPAQPARVRLMNQNTRVRKAIPLAACARRRNDLSSRRWRNRRPVLTRRLV